MPTVPTRPDVEGKHSRMLPYVAVSGCVSCSASRDPFANRGERVLSNRSETIIMGCECSDPPKEYNRKKKPLLPPFTSPSQALVETRPASISPHDFHPRQTGRIQKSGCMIPRLKVQG